MKKIVSLGCALALGVLLAGTAGAQMKMGSAKAAPGMHAAKTMTVKGEVLDLACYLSHGYHGKDHAMCARKCLKGGAPAGLLTAKGDVYLLVSHKRKINKAIAKLGGKNAEVTGTDVSGHGLKAIEVKTVKKAK